MYNKLFTKILDSSIWMEDIYTRLVWITFIAAMDESGFVSMASPANVAHRAVLPLDKTTEAIAKLEGPDPHSSDPENDGRRLERVPGGWMVLNAEKYRLLVTRETIKDQTKKRVQKFRDKKKGIGACNAPVTHHNEIVTPSDTVSISKEDKIAPSRFAPPTIEEVKSYVSEKKLEVDPDKFLDFYESKGWMVGKNKMQSWEAAVRSWAKNAPQNVVGHSQKLKSVESPAKPLYAAVAEIVGGNVWVSADELLTHTKRYGIKALVRLAKHASQFQQLDKELFHFWYHGRPSPHGGWDGYEPIPPLPEPLNIEYIIDKLPLLKGA